MTKSVFTWKKTLYSSDNVQLFYDRKDTEPLGIITLQNQTKCISFKVKEFDQLIDLGVRLICDARYNELENISTETSPM